MSLTPPRSLVTQYLYVELATKERPHHHAGNQTTALQHAKDVKDLVSEVRWGFYTTYLFAKEYFQSFPLLFLVRIFSLQSGLGRRRRRTYLQMRYVVPFPQICDSGVNWGGLNHKL